MYLKEVEIVLSKVTLKIQSLHILYDETKMSARNVVAILDLMILKPVGGTTQP